jgi:hypothetical protein
VLKEHTDGPFGRGYRLVRHFQTSSQFLCQILCSDFRELIDCSRPFMSLLRFIRHFIISPPLPSLYTVFKYILSLLFRIILPSATGKPSNSRVQLSCHSRSVSRMMCSLIRHTYYSAPQLIYPAVLNMYLHLHHCRYLRRYHPLLSLTAKTSRA